MSKEDLSRGVSFWLTQKLKIQNSEMIRFLYFLVLALFGIISATELSATELALMEQMLAVCDIPFISLSGIRIWIRDRWTSSVLLLDWIYYRTIGLVFKNVPEQTVQLFRWLRPFGSIPRSFIFIWVFAKVTDFFRMAICQGSTLHLNSDSSLWKIDDDSVMKSFQIKHNRFQWSTFTRNKLSSNMRCHWPVVKKMISFVSPVYI